MLKYIGNGSWLPGVPARDLTDEEVEELGGDEELVKSGLYARVHPHGPQFERPLKKYENPEVKDGRN